MRYRILGRSGLRVSQIALGTMTFGEAAEWSRPEKECRPVFDAYVDGGGNFIDTANMYEGYARTIGSAGGSVTVGDIQGYSSGTWCIAPA